MIVTERELSRYMLRIWERLPFVVIKLRRQSDGQSEQIRAQSVEDSEAFIKRLSDSDDNFRDEIYPDYVIEIEVESYDP